MGVMLFWKWLSSQRQQSPGAKACSPAAGRAPRSCRPALPQVPIFARALDLRHAAELQAAGATIVTSAECEAGLALGGQLAQALGAPQRAVRALVGALREDMQERQGQLAEEVGEAGASEQSSTSGGGNGEWGNGRKGGGAGGDGELASIFKVRGG